VHFNISHNGELNPVPTGRGGAIPFPITGDRPPNPLILTVPPFSILHTPLTRYTNDTSDPFRLLRVRSHPLLLPHLVLGAPDSVHRGRNERPDHAAGSYILANRDELLLRLTTPLLYRYQCAASVVATGIVRVLFVGITRVGSVVV